jgi:hypothetical protein
LARLLLTIYAEWLKRITINAAVSGSVHQGNQGNQMFVERFSNFILFFFFAQQQHTTLVNGHASCVLLLLYFYDIQCHERKKKKATVRETNRNQRVSNENKENRNSNHFQGRSLFLIPSIKYRWVFTI